jgi:hypothetical protein
MIKTKTTFKENLRYPQFDDQENHVVNVLMEGEKGKRQEYAQLVIREISIQQL